MGSEGIRSVDPSKLDERARKQKWVWLLFVLWIMGNDEFVVEEQRVGD